MEKSDTLKGIHRPDTNIMSFFNDIEEDNQLEKQKTAAELKKEQYLEKVNSLKKLVENVGTRAVNRSIQSALNIDRVVLAVWRH